MMENAPSFMQSDEGRSSKKGRLLGKLFGAKERKSPEVNSAANLDAFLHSSADNLEVTHPPPPPPPSTLPKLDTTISRYPQALAVNQTAQLNRPVAQGRPESKSPRTPRPNKKGMLVKFADGYPQVIGQGGDDCEDPVMEIARNKQMKPPPPTMGIRQVPPSNGPPPAADDDFKPKPLARTQTGFSSIYEPESADENLISPLTPPTKPEPGKLLPTRTATARIPTNAARNDENRRSFIEVQQAEMRKAEGQAFARAARTASVAYDGNWEDGAPPPAAPGPVTPDMSKVRQDSPEAFARRVPAPAEYSPAGSIQSNYSNNYPPSSNSPENSVSRQASTLSRNDIYATTSRMASVKLNDAAGGTADEALAAFVARTQHIYELFRLHAEAVKPIQTSTPKEAARAALWWFLKGRMGLETAVRERPSTPRSQMQNEVDRQQAYTNLAKGYWLCMEVVPEVSQVHNLPADPEVEDVVQTIVSALRKLSGSMQRNGFLPPEEQFLPQTVDKFIWLEYPPLSQDMVALLSGNWSSGISAMQQPLSTLQLLDAFPVGDTTEAFSYGRVLADVFLMEQGREAQRLYLPCMLSMVRYARDTGLIFVISSQNGVVQLAIQDNKKAGPTWNDIRWRNDTCTIDLRLPRGFIVAVQLSQVDYRMLWNMYDFGSKVRSTLYPRSDEMVVFQNKLRSFQYIDSDTQSRAFPKEPVALCDVALFEKVYKENGPSGQRNWHCGFRLAAVTGSRTRTLSGVHHAYPPDMPVQFGFFRADEEAPALSIKFDGARQKGRMVLVFGDEKERIRFHSLITGTALDADERIFANVPLKSFTIAQSIREPTGMAPFSRMPWKAARVVNDEFSSSGEQPPTVLADKLKVVLEYQNGTVTDRVNVAPGELRVRLEVSNAKVLRLLRQPQRDITMCLSESQVPKDLAASMTDSLQLIKQSQTVRTLEFTQLKDLHDFQFALTGYEVIFDALASTFAIARRRMVVPIHKKWEAGYTRIQVVRQEDKQLQLLAFFEDFQHGHCMNFVLKGTDIYESFHRSGKSGVKFVDAKFPLPRMPEDKDGDFDDMAFVCLDLPDLPGEHDDISIMFEKEAGEQQ